jgi:hypothetical protein
MSIIDVGDRILCQYDDGIWYGGTVIQKRTSKQAGRFKFVIRFDDDLSKLVDNISLPKAGYGVKGGRNVWIYETDAEMVKLIPPEAIFIPENTIKL